MKGQLYLREIEVKLIIILLLQYVPYNVRVTVKSN
jgi:hypothetical protein